MPRIVLAAILAVLSAAPVAAQALFLDACAASLRADDVAEDPSAVCACTTDRALEIGTTPADLDALLGYTDEDGALDPGGAPESVRFAALAMADALLVCTLAEGAALVAATPEPPVADAPATAVAATVTPAEAARAVASGAAPIEAPVAARSVAAPGGAPPAAAATPATPAPAAAPRRVGGLRTGNGTDQVVARKAGPGGAIRIVR